MSESQPSKVFMFDNDDPEMQGAYELARSTFRYFWRELSWERRRIIPALDTACVKAAFSDGPHGSRKDGKPQVEHMWMSEVDFDGQFVTGVLLNSPNWLKTVKVGDPARIPLDQITDWMYVIGSEVFGGYTVNLMRSRMGHTERQQHDAAWGLNFGDPAKIRIVPEPGKGESDLVRNWYGTSRGTIEDHPMSVSMAEPLKDQVAQDPSLVTTKDDRGWTILHSEALAGSAPTVKVLLDAGADRNAVTNQGMTPLQLAQALRWDKVIALLSESPAEGTAGGAKAMIEFACPACKRRYKVQAALAGKKTRCKSCQELMTIPMAAADAAAKPRLQPAPRASSKPAIATSAPPPPEAPALAPPSIPGDSFESSSATGRPKFVDTAMTMFNRYRPRAWWAWAIVAVLVILAIGLTHDKAAAGVLLVLGGLGLLLLAGALIWAAAIGVARGSRLFVGMVIAAPLAVLAAGLKAFLRQSGRTTPSPSSTGQTSPFMIVVALVIAISMIAILFTLVTNPKAFKQPAIIGGIGALLMALCVLPMMYRMQIDHTNDYDDDRFARSYSPGAGMTEYTPPRAPINRPPTSRQPTSAPTVTTLAPAPEKIVGDLVQVKWVGSWFNARVVRREGDWTWIEYESDKSREWVEPWRMRRRGSKVDNLPTIQPNSTWQKPNAPVPSTPPGAAPPAPDEEEARD